VVPSSSSFRIYGDGLNLQSGMSTSPSFTMSDCLGPGPEAAGASSSASFKLQVGCIYALGGLPADDDDGDGIPGGDENGAPNNGDGNDDGIADSEQANVASFPSATGEGYLTLEIPSNGPCGQLLGVEAVDPTTLGDGDPEYVYPFGMVRFHVENCAGPVMVTLYLHGGGGVVSAALEYRKYGFMAPDYVTPRDFYTFPGATFSTAMVGSQTVATVEFTLSDNVLGDDSQVALRIEDPSGPALAVVRAPAPALSPGGFAIALLLLSGVAFLALRRRA
jgi:hypothetical protein